MATTNHGHGIEFPSVVARGNVWSVQWHPEKSQAVCACVARFCKDREKYKMIVYPAIDLRGGRCVRLCQGNPDAETVYYDAPVVAARRWVEAGAAWLHVVNLDGALGDGGAALNLERLSDICAAVDVPVQFGGGLRSIDHIARAFDMGVARVLLATVAVCEPVTLVAALRRYGPQRVAVSLDLRDGRVATHGWTQVGNLDGVEVGRRLARIGVTTAVYTNIGRDGMLLGVDANGVAQFAHKTGLQVIAAGGVASAGDVRALREVAWRGVVGVIVGRALYVGAVDLTEAIRLASNGVGGVPASPADYPLPRYSGRVQCNLSAGKAP